MELTARFERALIYGTRLHKDQMRKGTGIPYVSHLLAVASIVLENDGTEDEVIAAFLHDAVEDQGGRKVLEDIGKTFGQAVADIVSGCTDAWTEPKPPWRERKEKYISHLNTATPSVLLVSCADKLHNARTILADYKEDGEKLWGRFRGGKEGTLWYYRALVDAFRKTGGPRRLIEGLDDRVTELERVVRDNEGITKEGLRCDEVHPSIAGNEIRVGIAARVHDYYWNENLSCAMTTLKILSEIFYTELDHQVIDAAFGLNAGRLGSQCGLVEGALMFIGIYGQQKGLKLQGITELCHRFSSDFQDEFGSLLCKELRPQGFSPDNPPHLCENITKRAVTFSTEFISKEILLDY